MAVHCRLLAGGAPTDLLEIMQFMNCRVTRDPQLHLVEYFCGVAAIAREFENSGLAAVGYDIDQHELGPPLRSTHDMCDDAGFIVALSLCWRTTLGEGMI
eukprot:4707865-Pyramimonas_sp.AAC.1